MKKFNSLQVIFKVLVIIGMLSLLSPGLRAQEGHPLNGSWSGERVVDGKTSRVLLVMELHRDQTLSGYVLENSKRSALQDVVLNPDDWSVSFELEQGYSVKGVIGELGSQTARTITGTWSDGSQGGEFTVDIN